MNNKSVVFVRKDKTLFDNKWKNIKEQDKTKYIYVDNEKGVAILPYKFDSHGKMHVMLRDEYNPLHKTLITVVSGRREDWETGSLWYQQTGRRELLEEAGIDAPESSFNLLDNIIVGKDYKRKDALLCVDVTGLTEHKPKTDGTIWEKKSTNFWVSAETLKKMIKESPGIYDSYLLAIIFQFLLKMGQIDKSEGVELMKAKAEISDTSSKLKGKEKPGHKYIRREGSPGSYKYIYEEPKGRKKKEEEPSKERLSAQLAELFGKKSSVEREKKAEKIDVLMEYSRVPKDMPDFAEGISAEQWLGMIDKASNDILNRNIADVKNSFVKYFERMPDLLNAPLDLTDDISSMFSSNKINIEDKTLTAEVHKALVKALSRISATKAIIDGMTGAMNSSIVENSFSQIASEIRAGDEKEDIRRYKSLRIFEKTIDAMISTLKQTSKEVKDLVWLSGKDKKLDFMIDQTFKSVDALMKTRNRFVLSTFKFFVEEIDKKLDNLNDSFSIESALMLINNFDSFNHNSINRSYTRVDMFEFTNQWNLKQNGVYDGASRYLTNAKSIIVEKVRNISENIGSPVIDLIVDKIIDNKSFNFLTMSGKNALFPGVVSEQALSYIDMFGLEKYKRDVFFMFGLTKSRIEARASVYSADAVKVYNSTLEVLDKTFNGLDVYNDEDVQDAFVEVFAKKMGNMSFLGSKYDVDIATLNAVMNSAILLNEKTPLASKIPAFIQVWSNFSHGSLAANMIEEMVNRKGIDRGLYVNYHLASNRLINLRNSQVKEVLGNTAEQIYNETQRQAKEDIGNEIALYRGNGKSEVKSVASSWTKNINVATNFGDHVVSAKIPAEAIFIYQNIENEDYWYYRHEKEHVIIPGLLSADKKIEFNTLSVKEIEKLKMDEFEKEALSAVRSSNV